jgi:YfiH family protein
MQIEHGRSAPLEAAGAAAAEDLRAGVHWVLPEWQAPAGVRALSTRRAGGVSSGVYASWNLGDHVGDAPEAVAENRRRLRAAAGLPAEPVWLRQVHGSAVADLDGARGGGQGHGDRGGAARAGDSSAGAGEGFDAAFTRRRGRVCAILTADCLPVLFAAADGGAVAAAHAGWRGLAAGVLPATVKALGVAPKDLLAWIGPAIGPRHFEVGPEVREALLALDPGAVSSFTLNSRGRFLADLPALAQRQLAAAGVGRIAATDECTYADPARYFSHRRDGQCGRQATLIWLE